MGLFSRNKGQQQQQQQQILPQRQPPASYANLPGPSPRSSGPPPASFIAAISPQPQPSPSQYQQELFHNYFHYLQSQQQQLLQQSALQPPHRIPHLPSPNAQDANNVTAAGKAAISAGGSEGTSSALFRQAVRQAAAEGKPLTINFLAKMQPVMTNNPYGINMPYPYPQDPQYGGGAAAPESPARPPPDWQPGRAQDPYDSIRIPALPDMRSLPLDLQEFREQCAIGVRQAVAMVTSMEHQLFYERTRRQQAEEDCKVLLAAVAAERQVGEEATHMEAVRRAEGGRLTLAAEDLPVASEAATTIQKHVRGRLARKEFETHLRDILRGVDPSLDPAALPAAATNHINNVNATGAPRRLGLRALLGEVVGAAGGGDGGSPSGSSPATAYYRTQVDRIGQRLGSYKDAGEPHPGDRSGDPLQADVKQLLSGSYPASSAQVIAALVRRCRELQASLLEAVGELQQAQLTIQGVKAANSGLTELSGLHADLEASRADNLRLAATVARLRTVIAAAQQQPGAAGLGGEVARDGGNPYLAGWYRRAYADQEWPRTPQGGRGGVTLIDRADAPVEMWEPLRPSAAEPPPPLLVPQPGAPSAPYRDLLALTQDMLQTAGPDPANPLYSLPVPDRSGFKYERDTPLMAVQTPAPIIRDTPPPEAYLAAFNAAYRGTTPRPISTPGGGGGSAASEVLSSSGRRRPPSDGSGGGGGGGAVAGGSGRFRYNQDTPVVPVYSVLPLIREEELARRSTSPLRGHAAMPPPPPGMPPPPQLAALPPPSASAYPYHQPSLYPSPSEAVQTANVPTNLAYIRDQVRTPPPPPEAVAAAALAMTPHWTPQQQQTAMQSPYTRF